MRKFCAIVFMMFFCFGMVSAQQASPFVCTTSGGFFQGTTISQSWTVGEPLIDTYSGQNLILTQGFQQPGASASVSGVIKYDNNAGTLMNNLTVKLKLGNTVYSSTTTGSQGQYLFSDVPNGTYTLQTVCNKPWGGGNSIDALLVMKHFTNIAPLTGIRLKAADVDGGGFVNTTDALLIMKRFVGMIPSFNAGNYVFEQHQITVNGAGNITDNYKGVCVGDVDGSFNPPAVKTEPSVEITYAGVRGLESIDQQQIPVTLDRACQVSAYSLVLKYPQQLIEIQDVMTNVDAGNLVFHAENGELRIAWYTLSPLQISDHGILFYLKVKPTSALLSEQSVVAFETGPESVVADFEGQTIEGLHLEIPLLTMPEEGFVLCQNQPNPFQHNTSIPFYLTSTARVKLTVADITGRKLAVLADDDMPAGANKIDINLGSMANGIYIYRMEVTTDHQTFIQSKRMIINH